MLVTVLFKELHFESSVPFVKAMHVDCKQSSTAGQRTRMGRGNGCGKSHASDNPFAHTHITHHDGTQDRTRCDEERHMKASSHDKDIQETELTPRERRQTDSYLDRQGGVPDASAVYEVVTQPPCPEPWGRTVTRPVSNRANSATTGEQVHHTRVPQGSNKCKSSSELKGESS